MNDYPILEFKNSVESNYSFDLVQLKKLLETKHRNHSPFDFHQIDFFAFILYLEGEESHTIDFTEYNCKRGTLLAIRKGQIHKFSNSNLKGTILLFSHDFLGSFFTQSEAQKSLLLFNDFLFNPKIQLNKIDLQNILKITQQIEDEYVYTRDDFSPSIIRSLMQIFINQLYRFKTSQETTITNKKNLKEFIEFQNLIETRFSQTLKVKDYASWLGLTTKAINTTTKNIINKTAKEFIDEICINNIKRELVNSSKSIKEIGYICGFEESTNFNNYFKKRVGKTPLEYRKTQ